MLHGSGNIIHVTCHAPEEFLNLSPRGEIKKSEAEKLEGFLTNLKGIMPIFKYTGRIYLIPDSVELSGKFMRVFSYLICFLIPFRQLRCLKHFDYKHRVMCRH